jgi:hypothetical protein
VSANNRQGRDAAQRFNSGHKAHAGTLNRHRRLEDQARDQKGLVGRADKGDKPITKKVSAKSGRICISPGHRAVFRNRKARASGISTTNPSLSNLPF